MIFPLFLIAKIILQHVVMDHETTAKLIEEGDINHVVFTGAVAGGEKIYGSTAKRHFDCNLELGGKDPMIILEDADIDMAITSSCFGAAGTCGQRCTTLRRMFIHENV